MWAFLATTFIIIAPLVSEVWDIYRAFSRNVRVKTFPEPNGVKANTSRDTAIEITNSDNNKRADADNKTETTTVTGIDNVHLSAFSQFKTRESVSGLEET